jgi:hypothetical protein
VCVTHHLTSAQVNKANREAVALMPWFVIGALEVGSLGLDTPALPEEAATAGGIDAAVDADEGVGARVAADDGPSGVVYRRTDANGGKPYFGQAKSLVRYVARQSEHARANPLADFDFEIVGRAEPGIDPDRLEEYYIREGGGPTNLRNPEGSLANMRHQMSDSRYLRAGEDPIGQQN